MSAQRNAPAGETPPQPWAGPDLAAWRERMGLPWRKAAKALGVSLSYFQDQCKAPTVDRRTELAARFLEEHPDELPRE